VGPTLLYSQEFDATVLDQRGLSEHFEQVATHSA
jgi:hypothetical protein